MGCSLSPAWYHSHVIAEANYHCCCVTVPAAAVAISSALNTMVLMVVTDGMVLLVCTAV